MGCAPSGHWGKRKEVLQPTVPATAPDLLLAISRDEIEGLHTDNCSVSQDYRRKCLPLDTKK